MTAFEHIALPDGRRAFRKYLARGASDCFRAEAAGLAAMAATDTVPTPAVIRVSERELVTELIDEGVASASAWAVLGGQLAAMHSLSQPHFGFTADNYCGATVQINPACEDGFAFFARHRLLYQAEMAGEAGLLEPDEIARVESIASRLPQLVPAQAPALLHGDLWGGNVLFGTAGPAWLIDPAAYWGWPEADLAMTTLFGEFDPAFYAGYLEQRALEPGWRDRLPLYNLYHLLNHLNLFGRGYHAQVCAVLHRYT